MTKKDTSQTDSPKNVKHVLTSEFQSKIELKMVGQQYGWQPVRMQYELKLLLTDWFTLAQVAQGGKCDRCLAPLSKDNIDDSTVSTYVHLECPVETSAFRQSTITKYLKRHGVA